ncbi:MAG: pentapeptide repeat-containing protein [Campylobacteraceae bacterium]|nr:pentapeptide repeat-containing protein [Campylobacteraceae bacterium]
MDFPDNAYKYLSDEERIYFQYKSKEELQKRWKTEEGEEFTRKILEINLVGGSYRNYSSFLGFVKNDFFKDDLKVDLRGFDLSSYSNVFQEKIVSLDFSFCDLSYATFNNSELNKCQFMHSNMEEVDFSNTLLQECDFSYSNLDKSDFSFSNLENTQFLSSNINAIVLKKTNLKGLKFNKKVDFSYLDIKELESINNPAFLGFLRQKMSFKEKIKNSLFQKIVYFFWLKYQTFY